MNLKATFFTTLIAAFCFSCQDQSEETLIEVPDPQPEFVNLQDLAQLNAVNARLAPRNLAVYSAEYITNGAQHMGNIVFFKDTGNKQLSADFAPGMSLDGSNNISYYIDNNRPSNDLPFSATEAAIDRAMTTWDNVTCSELGINKVPFDGRENGFVSFLLSFGGSLDYVADVNHAGWLPREFFDFLAAGGGDFILGVTFTLIFTDEMGNPVDTNNDGKIDVAFREIYYNDEFPWNINSHYDVETIALHEAGHGLSQGHFGKAFRTVSNNKIHFAPRAVMNAAYSGIQQNIEKTDNAGHCSIWANWPNK